MRDELAEALLAKVMGWSDEEKARERPILQDFARYKYDEYQQYAPGRRFIESLALWLRQFKTPAERNVAYDFFRTRLIFISTAEIRHLVELAFPMIIQPGLIAKTAAVLSVDPQRSKYIVSSPVYKQVLRQTLFLGLSDGARTDVFRRSHPQISNEQLWHAYDISNEKAASMQKKLKKALEQQLAREPTEDECKFHTLCLLDDFSASGTSYIRLEDGQWDGKIPKILQKLCEDDDALSQIFAKDNIEVVVCIYVAAHQAMEHIEADLKKFNFPKGRVRLKVVHSLPSETRLHSPDDDKIIALATDKRYFDKVVDDEHADVGGTSMRFGYADCRLPLILPHNAPNNSLYLLWGEYEQTFTGLFPRVSRHKRGG